MDPSVTKEALGPAASRIAACRGGDPTGDDRDRVRGTPSRDEEGGSNHQDHIDDHERSHDDLHSRRPGPGQIVARSDGSGPKIGGSGTSQPTGRGGIRRHGNNARRHAQGAQPHRQPEHGKAGVTVDGGAGDHEGASMTYWRWPSIGQERGRWIRWLIARIQPPPVLGEV
jgi:hypothetical protein